MLKKTIMSVAAAVAITASALAASPTPGTGGDKYVPYDQRTGNESIVYFTRDLSAKGLEKVYEKVNGNIHGKVAVKLHTGEKNGPNILPRSWVKDLIDKDIPNATIVETNTLYPGDRDTTEKHREAIHVNGWDKVAPVDITDENGTAMLPVKGGKWLKEISVGKDLLNYDSLVVLTHFKGHTMGGFGGSNKNIGIGCADGKIGKRMVHIGDGHDGMGNDPKKWDMKDWIVNEELMERITESTKGTIDHFGKNVTYVNTLRNMSVDCDCAGLHAAPVVTPNIGILASTDILAADQASVDMIYALHKGQGHDLRQRIESRHGLRQLSYMKEMGMGNDKYILVDVDNNKVITPEEAVQGVKPFKDDGAR